MTTFVDPSPLLGGLPTDPQRLCTLGQKLIVHEFMAPAYGVTDAPERLDELENRSVAHLVAAIDRCDPRHRPLARPRSPVHRLVGNCRQFVVLAVALLRRSGVPARARAGFACYLDDTWTDHWILQRWDTGRGRWVWTDPQLDAVFRKELTLRFDPLDVPDGLFLPGAVAWQRCRAGLADPAAFGIDDLRGLWFVAGNVIRDLAALNKVELLPWDVWGAMPAPGGPVDVELVDEVAATVVADRLDDLRALYRRDGLRVPHVVHSARFGRAVRI